MPGPNPVGGGDGGDRQFKATVALGAVVKVCPATFQRLLTGQTAPLVVRYAGGWWRPSYRYLTAYKGLFFYTKSKAELRLPAEAEVVEAQWFGIPGLD